MISSIIFESRYEWEELYSHFWMEEKYDVWNAVYDLIRRADDSRRMRVMRCTLAEDWKWGEKKVDNFLFALQQMGIIEYKAIKAPWGQRRWYEITILVDDEREMIADG